MADKDLKLILKVDSRSGQAEVKKLAGALKGLESTSLSKDVAASSDKMKEMARNTARAAEEYRKIADVSKRDAERLQKRINLEKQRAAVINRAHGEAIRMERKRAATIDKVNRKTKEQVKTIGSIKQKLFALRSYWLAISAAVSIVAITVAKFFKASFMSVEKFRLAVASMAASITTFSDLSAGNVDEIYANAYRYAEKLALQMEIINARTIASGEQLRAMNETFIQQGVLLDVNNKKQEDSFVAIANAISLITQGQNQEIQMRQEIRGLISGDIRATNLLARMIDAKLGGSLKESIKLWKQQGTLLVNLGKHLEGFKAGSADLAKTWAALSTTFKTIADRYLRQIFKPIYEDIIEMSLDFSRSLLDQKDDTESLTTETGNLHKAWIGIKTATNMILSTIKNMHGPTSSMAKFLGKALEGFVTALIGAEVFMGRLSAVISEGVAGIKLFAQHLKNVVKLDFSKEAAVGLEKLSKEFEEAGIKSAGKFSIGFIDEWKVKYHEMMGSLKLPETKKDAIKPDLVTVEDLEKLKAEIKLAKEKAKNHEKVLSFISTEHENKKRAIAQETGMVATLAEKMGWTEKERLRILEAGQKKLDILKSPEEKIALKKEKETKEKMLEIQETFNADYAKIGKSKFDIERDELLSSMEDWKKYGFDKVRIARLTSKKIIDIEKAEAEKRLDSIHDIASSMVSGFKMISEMGGKHSKEAFKMYKAFKIVETIISTRSAAMKAFEAGMSVGGPAAPAIAAAFVAATVAFGAMQVNMIQNSQPPSYDQGGISNAQGIYQTGNIAEAHIPLPSGRKIPVEISDKAKPNITIHMENPVFQDVETQRQVFSQIAEIVARKVAPEAVVENYNNDGQVRSMIRSGI